MPRWKAEKISVGHVNERRVIRDVVIGGVGENPIQQISSFEPLYAGNYIGRHFHSEMHEVYYIFFGTGTMHLKDEDTGHAETIRVSSNWRIVIPPRVSHELRAETDITLFIAATGPQGQDTFPVDSFAR